MKRMLRIAFVGSLGLILAAPGIRAAEESPSAAPEEPEAAPARSYSIRYRLDVHGMVEKDHPATLEVMAAEAEVTGEVGQHFSYAVQIPFYTSMEGRGRGMHFGNLYVIYRGKLGEPTVKVGQFVLPFGNLPYYETHTRPVQTLYRYSLGARIDPGIAVEGYLGKATEFQVAVTTGNGPYRKDNNGNKVVTARVSHTFELGDNELRLGVSALRGKLPVFSLMSEPGMSGGDVLEFSDKNRVAVDAEFYWGPYLVRAEVVAGDDNGRGAYGHWLQFSYPLSYRTSLEAGMERWSQFSGGLTGYWAGIEHKLSEGKTARLVFETGRRRESGMSMETARITGQFLVEF